MEMKGSYKKHNLTALVGQLVCDMEMKGSYKEFTYVIAGDATCM